MTFLITPKLCKVSFLEWNRSLFVTRCNYHNGIHSDHCHLQRKNEGLGRDKRSESRKTHKEQIYIISGEALLHLQVIGAWTHNKEKWNHVSLSSPSLAIEVTINPAHVPSHSDLSHSVELSFVNCFLSLQF